MASQYAYSNISIISGIFGLAVTIFINIISSFISLSRLHFDGMPTSIVWISQMLNPALWSYRAALMVDHDNTNPIKAVYLEWFSDRLQLIRKAEVSIRSCCFQALLILFIGEKCSTWECCCFSPGSIQQNRYFSPGFDEFIAGIGLLFCTNVIW
jgi:hypothetical protein